MKCSEINQWMHIYITFGISQIKDGLHRSLHLGKKQQLTNGNNLVNFKYIELNYGMIVAETHPHQQSEL